MTSNIRALLRSRDLVFILTWRNIRIRYKQAVMGFLWAILSPTIAVGAAVLVPLAIAQRSGGQLSTARIGVSLHHGDTHRLLDMIDPVASISVTSPIHVGRAANLYPKLRSVSDGAGDLLAIKKP